MKETDEQRSGKKLAMSITTNQQTSKINSREGIEIAIIQEILSK